MENPIMEYPGSTDQANYLVNFNLPFNGPDQGGSRVFNPLEELANSGFKVSFENSNDSYQDGISYHGMWGGPGVVEDADESEFIETVRYFQYTDSDGKSYFITPTDGSQMLLLSATEAIYHSIQVDFYKALGKEYAGGALSFDWYFISDMSSLISGYENGAGGVAGLFLDNEFQLDDSGFFAYENSDDLFEEMDEWEDEDLSTGSSNGWQTQIIPLDPEVSYDALWLELGVLKDEDWGEDDDDNGDVYLLVDNIQLTGLNDMMQFGQVENALWNHSDWSVDIKI